MCDRPKIHVFLGAPPPSSGPVSGSTAGGEGGEHLSPQWRQLQLTWQGGRLRLAGGEAGNQVGLSSEENNTGADRCMLSLQNQDDKTITDQDESSSNTDWTTDMTGARRKRAQSGCEFSAEEDHSSHAPKPADGALRGDSESPPEMEAPCSASVQEYLDSSFPAAQAEVEHSSNSQSHSSSPCLSPYTHFLQTWTLSQALVLRGKPGVQSAVSPEKAVPQTLPQDIQSPPSLSSSTPELFSPVTPSPAASMELFSHVWPSPRVEEGGIILEATTEGILCTQQADQEEQRAAQTPSPSSKSPDLKRTRVSEKPASEASSSHCTAGVGLQVPTTPLIHCDKQGQRYSALVAVVHPCHLREIKIKSGRASGTFVPLASIVVTDQSGVEKKIVLWRRAAFWVLTVSPGDILLITGLQVNEDRWRGETVLQSTFSSKLLNLGQACTSPQPVPQSVNPHSLSVLCGFLREQRPLLVCLSRRPLQDMNRLPYATLRCLRVNTLVHALLRVTHTHISTEWQSEADSRWRSAAQLKAVLTVDQPGGQQGTLVLWGAALDWLPRFKHSRATVWDFHLLLVREGLTSDLLELHSTPWSSVQPLEPAQRVQEFLRAGSAEQAASGAIELDLDTLLSQKYSGIVELRVQITAFRFQSPPPAQYAQQLLDSTTPLDGIVAALTVDVTYTGCGRCAAELDTDVNGIYCPCYPCLPHTAVRRYYRPGVLTVNGQGITQVCVQVPPVQLQEILEVPPDRLHSSSAPGSDRKQIQVAAERIQSLLSLPRKPVSVTVRSHFLCDENSIALSQDLTLLSLHFPS